MEEGSDSPPVVKVEEHSKYVVLTYFQGDINSMVDAHFNRALHKILKAKAAPAARAKKDRKTIKLENSNACQSTATCTYSASQIPSVSGHLVTISSAEDAPSSWHSFTSRTVENPGLPSITHSLSQDGLSLTGQQYASSLLNLLHSDHRGEMGPSMASGSKTELLPSWIVQQGLRESVDPAVGFEPERRLDKGNLYWY